MGISGNPQALIHLEKLQNEQIPIIRRFSGGGTVIVDENTLFITFIMAKRDVDIQAFPEPILRWSAEVYKEAWKIPHFQLIENDYCIKDLKIGGNAQYIQKDRWLHHTSFLWDFDPKNMEYLLMPPKRPKYRLDRPHHEFLTCMKKHAKSKGELIDQLQEELVKRFYMRPFDLSQWSIKEHRKSTYLFYPPTT